MVADPRRLVKNGFVFSSLLLLRTVQWVVHTVTHTVVLRRPHPLQLCSCFSFFFLFFFLHTVLTGLLIYVPTSSRAGIGALLCMVAVANLNYFHPHKNPILFWLTQLSFMTTGAKYVMALLLSAGNAEGGGESSTNCNQYITEDACAKHSTECIWDASEICTSPLIGTILISLDVVFMASSLLAIPTALFLLKKRFEKHNAHSNNDVVIYPAINTTRRSPKFAALLESHKARLDQAVLVNQVGRIGKLGRVKSKRTKKVEEIENNHESSRAASLAAIRTRQTQARERLNTRRRSRTATSRNVKAAKIEKEPTAAAAELNLLELQCAAQRSGGEETCHLRWHAPLW